MLLFGKFLRGNNFFMSSRCKDERRNEIGIFQKTEHLSDLDILIIQLCEIAHISIFVTFSMHFYVNYRVGTFFLGKGSRGYMVL